MMKIVLNFDTLYISFFPQIFSQIKGTYSFPSSLPLRKKKKNHTDRKELNLSLWNKWGKKEKKDHFSEHYMFLSAD